MGRDPRKRRGHITWIRTKEPIHDGFIYSNQIKSVFISEWLDLSLSAGSWRRNELYWAAFQFTVMSFNIMNYLLRETSVYMWNLEQHGELQQSDPSVLW